MTTRKLLHRIPLPGLLIIVGLAACARNPDPGVVAAPAVLAYCNGARDYLSERFGNPALVEPDSIQDWRTRQTFPGCRVYAAAPTSVDMNVTAQRFYEAILASGWIRTPDARDMPNEAAIRLRKDGMDCLYHVYSGPLLGTLLEIRVSGAVTLEPGDQRYNVLVQCMPAMPAAPA